MRLKIMDNIVTKRNNMIYFLIIVYFCLIENINSKHLLKEDIALEINKIRYLNSYENYVTLIVNGPGENIQVLILYQIKCI